MAQTVLTYPDNEQVRILTGVARLIGSTETTKAGVEADFKRWIAGKIRAQERLDEITEAQAAAADLFDSSVQEPEIT